jgi:hypothetical protein
MKPLSKKARRISLLTSLLLFIIIGPLVLAYSLGYRYSTLEESLGWIKTGGIYIHSDVSGTEVYVDGEFVKTTGLLIRNTFVQNLKTDRTYIVEVYKDGYHGWRKELLVSPSFVTEARTLMLPTEIEEVAILPFVDLGGVGTTTDSAETILNSEYRRLEIIFDLASSTENVSDNIVDRLDIFEEIDLELSTTSTSTVNVPDYFLDLGITNPNELENLIVNNDEVLYLEEGNVIVNWIGKETEVPYYFCTYTECENQIILDWDTDILRFNYLPNRSDILVVLNEAGVWAVEVDDRSVRNIQPIYLGENLDFRINSNNRIVVLDEGIFYELRF